jgi:magnesium-transporting ATPase (P-type)
LRQKYDNTFKKDELGRSTIGMNQLPLAFWSVSASDALQQLGAAKEGLSGEEARQRRARYGSNLLKPKKRSNVFTLLLAQFKSPLILLCDCCRRSAPLRTHWPISPKPELTSMRRPRQ